MELRTPEGAKLSKQLDDFFASRKALIDKSNPQMGKIDQTGSAKMYDFMTMVRDRVDEYKRQGKDPRVLLDPKSPEFLGSPETLAPYQTTIQESIRTLSESLKRGRAEKPPDENASKKGFFNWFKSDPKPEAKPQSAPDAPSSSPVPKDSTAQMRGAIADLEKAVRTMPGKDPVIVGPRKAGESAAEYLKRWNEAHKND